MKPGEALRSGVSASPSLAWDLLLLVDSVLAQDLTPGRTAVTPVGVHVRPEVHSASVKHLFSFVLSRATVQKGLINTAEGQQGAALAVSGLLPMHSEL